MGQAARNFGAASVAPSENDSSIRLRRMKRHSNMLTAMQADTPTMDRLSQSFL